MLENDYFGSAITNKINTAISEKFNQKQAEKFLELMISHSKRQGSIIPIQYIIKKDNDNQIVIFYITTRFNGTSRCDTRWVTLFDKLGNVRTFEESETCEDHNSDKWLEKELAKQLLLNSETLFFIYKDGDAFIENTRFN
jgi:hypothetical protein